MNAVKTPVAAAVSNVVAQESSLAPEQQRVMVQIDRIVQIFKHSNAAIRPHFLLTGPSGSGKSHLVQYLAEQHKMHFIEINAAALTKEGTSGNSLSKALVGLRQCGGGLTLCFVDEFDKLFISGNTNSELAHETTNGVQNEFLKVLEGKTTAVFGDYGKYVDVPVSNVLFIFAGAFNGEEDIDVDRLRAFGIKTEFIGRVGLVFNLSKLSVASMRMALRENRLFHSYLKLFPRFKAEKVEADIMEVVEDIHEKNTLGVRLLNTLLHQYFINGGVLPKSAVRRSAFNSTMDFPEIPHEKETQPASEEEVMAVLDFAPEGITLTPEQEMDVLGEPDFTLPDVPKRTEL